MPNKYTETIGQMVSQTELAQQEIFNRGFTDVRIDITNASDPDSSLYGTELFGWVVCIAGLELDYGFIRDDNCFGNVVRIEISDMELNKGKMPVRLYKYIDHTGKKVDREREVFMSPDEYLNYLNHLITTGEYLIKLK